jgi:hypothetical protein
VGGFLRHRGTKFAPFAMEFRISLAIEETNSETKVYFRLFNEQFEMTLKEFSIALGFHKRCILDPNTLAEKY